MTISIKEPEYVCPVCGKTFERYKALHGHMMLRHRDYYEACGFSLSAFGIKRDPFERIVREIKKANQTAEAGVVEKEETR